MALAGRQCPAVQDSAPRSSPIVRGVAPPSTREVLVAGINGLELAAINRDAGGREQTHQAA